MATTTTGRDALEQMGLKRREAACYIALLELGPSGTGCIVKKTGIPSSKIYEILDRLLAQGLASCVTKNGKKEYRAADPKALLRIADERRRALVEAMPVFVQHRSISSSNEVEIFEGRTAVFRMFTAMIDDARAREQYLVFSIDEENKDDSVNLFFKNLAVRRKEKRLDTLLLKNARRVRKERHTKLQLRYTDLSLPQGVTVFRDNVILLSWAKEPVAVRIRSEQFASQMRKFFLELWRTAKRE
ncbi:TPA: hypothetical protein HA251_07100 [Candidatus Woesearchaeota archaeon]|nr:hypothetical protein [Candidatus Woesearchaeota archaeon]